MSFDLKKIIFQFAKFFPLVGMVLVFQSCGGRSGGSPTLSGGGGGNIGVAFASIYIEHEGENIAQVIDIYQDTGKLYLLEENRYVSVNLKTGIYSISQFVHGDESCTGNKGVAGFAGESGAAVVFDGTNYYLVGEVVGGFSYKSFSGPQYSHPNWNYGCISSSAIPQDYPLPVYTDLTAVPRPYDFESIAPLSVVYSIKEE